MAALTFYACNAIHQLWDLSNVFVTSGFNFNYSYRYLQAKRRDYLFRKYCREVWHEVANPLERRYISNSNPCDLIDAIDVVGSAAAVDDDEIRIENFESEVQIVKLKQKLLSADTLDSTNLKDTNFIRSAKMSRYSGIDFAAMEATMEATENQLRQEEGDMRRQRLGSDIVEDFEQIEVFDGEEVDSTYYEYCDAQAVYKTEDVEPLQEGISYTFNGYIMQNCERFSINFVLSNEHSDVALHINPRLPQNYIVRNTRVKEVWGKEEVTSALPFILRRGTKFSIQVLVTDACYMISVNGHHFAEYNHRLPYTKVGCIEVKGDVDNIDVERQIVEAYPHRFGESQAKDIRVVGNIETTPITGGGGNEDSGMDEGDYDDMDITSIPDTFKYIQMQNNRDASSPSQNASSSATVGLSLPYYGKLPASSFTVGRCLRIEGRVKLLPHSFYINLQKGQHIWPHAVIAFHFNPRFSKQNRGALYKHVVIRNAWYDGKWAVEERSELDTDLRPGKTFSLAIVCGKRSYEVYVNRKWITEFTHQLKPEIVDTIYVQGDIKLWDVILDTNTWTNTRKKIYQNPAYTTDDF